MNLKDFSKIMSSMDQPSIDGINTWYACKAAAEQKIKSSYVRNRC